MESTAPTRVLVVAYRTAATPRLLEAVRERAGHGPCHFTLLVPAGVRGISRVLDPEDHANPDEARVVLDLALPLLEDAAGSPVEGIVGVSDALDAIQDAVNLRGFDEIIISTLPARISRWLHVDLPSKVSGLGLPVTTVGARERATAAAAVA